MITSIHIENFQSHADTKIDFAPNGRLTVIVGPTDSGKTAAFRALRWVAYNEPTGTDFIRAGATRAKVTITLADGRTVIRERSKSVNRYTIAEPGQDDLVLEGFGVGVPLEVQDALGTRPVAVGDQEFNLNLAEQLDGPFLGRSVPATQKAKVLGKLAGTEEVDLASKQLGTDLYRRRQDEKTAAADVDQLQEQLEGYAYLEPLGDACARVAELLTEAKAAEVKQEQLTQLRTRLAETTEQIRFKEACLNAMTVALSTIEPRVTATVKASGQWQRLSALADRLCSLDEGLAQVNGALQETATATEATGILDGAMARAGKLARIQGLNDKLRMADQGLAAAGDTLRLTGGADHVGQLVTSNLADTERLSAARRLAQHLNEANDGIARQDLTLTRLADLDMARALINKAMSRAGRLATLRDHYQSIESIERRILMAGARIVANKDLIRGLRTRYESVLSEAGRCPTCGAAGPEMRLKEVI